MYSTNSILYNLLFLTNAIEIGIYAPKMGGDGSKQIDFATIFLCPDQQMFPQRFGSDNNSRIPARTVDIHCKVNAFGLADNCYYITLAGILGTNVNDLVTSTEIMQERGSANLEKIDTLYQTVRSPIHILYSFENIGDLESFLIPFTYQISSQRNHMVALYVRRDSATRRIIGRLVDYQSNTDDPRRVAFQIPPSEKYYVFDTVQFFPSMHDDL